MTEMQKSLSETSMEEGDPAAAGDDGGGDVRAPLLGGLHGGGAAAGRGIGGRAARRAPGRGQGGYSMAFFGMSLFQFSFRVLPAARSATQV